MSGEENRALTIFRTDVNTHTLFCRQAMQIGNQAKAVEWFDDLVVMESNWETALAKLARPMVASGSWARGYKIQDTKDCQQLARARLEIVREAINDLHRELKAKGWI